MKCQKEANGTFSVPSESSPSLFVFVFVLMIADVFVYLQYILCVDDAVVVHVAYLTCGAFYGDCAVLDVLVDAEYVLCIDCAVVVHVFEGS